MGATHGMSEPYFTDADLAEAPSTTTVAELARTAAWDILGLYPRASACGMCEWERDGLRRDPDCTVHSGAW